MREDFIVYRRWHPWYRRRIFPLIEYTPPELLNERYLNCTRSVNSCPNMFVSNYGPNFNSLMCHDEQVKEFSENLPYRCRG